MEKKQTLVKKSRITEKIIIQLYSIIGTFWGAASKFLAKEFYNWSPWLFESINNLICIKESLLYDKIKKKNRFRQNCNIRYIEKQKFTERIATLWLTVMTGKNITKEPKIPGNQYYA